MPDSPAIPLVATTFGEAFSEAARATGAWWLFGGVLVTLVLLRFTKSWQVRRVRFIAAFGGVHLAMVALVAFLAVNAPAWTKEAELLLAALAAVNGVNVVGTLLFLVVLPRLRIPAPRIVQDVVFAIAYLVTLFIVGNRMGLNLSGLIATSAVVTAVIGFSLQDTLGNIMGGLALQLDDSIGVGDWVKVGDVAGRVVEIRWRSTSIETRNWETVILPNSQLMKGQVIVLGRRTDKPVQWRRWVYFNVDYRTPPTAVIEAVEKALRARPIKHVAADPAPNCILMDFADSYGRYAARYWLTDLAADDPTDSAVRTVIYFALQRAHIRFARPVLASFVTKETQGRKERKEAEELARRLEAVSHVELFAPLSDELRQRLARGLDHAPFARGDVLTQQGAEAHWLYILVEGDASVRVRAGDVEREVAQLHAGQFFGEMSLMTGEPRSATVVATTEVRCYRLDKSVFQAIVQELPELAGHVADVLARRRSELRAVKEGLDAEAKARALELDKQDLLARITAFFERNAA